MPFLQMHNDIGDSMGHVVSLQADFSHFEESAEVRYLMIVHFNNVYNQALPVYL